MIHVENRVSKISVDQKLYCDVRPQRFS